MHGKTEKKKERARETIGRHKTMVQGRKKKEPLPPVGNKGALPLARGTANGVGHGFIESAAQRGTGA
jgi:hypothetical protein